MEMNKAAVNNIPKKPVTVEDRLQQARAMVERGHYDRALKQYHRLLEKKYITSAVINGVAHCLVHLVRPIHIGLVIDRFANDLFKHPRNREVFKHSIARKISREQHPRHHAALFREK